MKANPLAYSSLDSLKHIESIEEEKHVEPTINKKSYHALNQPGDDQGSSATSEEEKKDQVYKKHIKPQ